MTNRSDLTLVIQANTDALRAVQAEYGKIGAGAHSAAQQAVSALDRIKSTAAGMGLERIGEALATGLKNQAAAAFTAGETLEGLRNRYTLLLGSQQAATEELSRLQQLANSSPFELKGLAKAEADLMATGKNAAAARAELLAIAQTGAGLALTQEQVQGVTLALTQLANKGRVSSEELGQMAERGVPALQILAQYLGKTAGETQKLVESGQVASGVFEQAFAANATQRFSTALATASTSMTGLVSTAADLRDQLGGNFMESAFKEAEPTIARVLGELQDPRTVENLRQMGKEFGQGFERSLTTIERIAQELGILATPDPAQTALTTAKAQLAAVQATLATQQQGTQATTQQVDANKALEAQLRAVNRQEQDVRKNYRDLIDPLQEALRLENERYQAATKARDLRRAESKLSQDVGLAGDLFTSAGQAARDRIEGERDRVSDLQFEQSHQRRVDGINDQIAARKKQEQAALDALDKEKRGLELQQEGLRTTNKLIGAQQQGILGLTGYINGQVKAVQDLATAWGQVRAAQGQVGITTDAAGTDKSNMGQLAGLAPATGTDWGALVGNSLSKTGSMIWADLFGTSQQQELAHRQGMAADAALGMAAQQAVLGAAPPFPFPQTGAGAPLGRSMMGMPGTTLAGLYNPAVTAAMHLPGGTGGLPQKVEVVITVDENGVMRAVQKGISDPRNAGKMSQNLADYSRGRQRGWDR